MGGGVSTSRNTEENFINQISRLGVGFELELKELKSESVFFLRMLLKESPDKFEQLLIKLEQHPLMLKAHHIDKVVTLISHKMTLPKTILESIARYVGLKPDFELIIDQLFRAHARELLISAKTHNLIHHSLPHALEISNRVSYVLDGIGILPKNNAVNRFLRAIANVLIQFHDLEQKNKGAYNSVEEATAAEVLGLLTTSLEISDNLDFLTRFDLLTLFDFMADRIIVLGTTMIFSPKRTMDLSELFLEFKAVASCSGLCFEQSELMRYIDAIMLITGVCDKNPVAIYDLAAQQAANPSLSTLPIVNHYFQRPLLLESFFTGSTFSHPFDGSSEAINRQAFLMTLVPHLCMRAELSGSLRQSEARTFIELISLCRKERLNMVSLELFMFWYKEQCHRYEMNRVVSAFFFEAIDRETEFCQSQQFGLVFVAKALADMQFSSYSFSSDTTAGNRQLLINPAVPVMDANNLKALKIFYDNLDHSQKEVLISELLFAVVVQAGQINAEALPLMLSPAKSVPRITYPTANGEQLFFADKTLAMQRSPPRKSVDGYFLGCGI